MNQSRIFVQNDVKLEDILNAPSSLSVSLKTATEINEMSFFRSNEKGDSQFPYNLKPKNNINDSYIVYQDEASMIKEAPDQEDDNNNSILLQYKLISKGTFDNQANVINI